MAGAVATLVTTVPDALDRIAEIGGAILGLLLIGAAIGAGALGFIAGATAAFYWIRGRRERGEQLTLTSREQPALPPSNLPVLYTAPSQKPRWSTAIAIALITAALLGLVGWFLVRESRLCLGDGCGPQPTPGVTEIIVTPTPEPDESAGTAPPSTSPEVGTSHTVLSPDEVATVALSEEEIEGVLGVNSYADNRDSLFNPINFDLCSGVGVSTSDIGNEYSLQVETGDGGFDDSAGTWVVSFKNDGASEVISQLTQATAACDVRERPGAVYGEETVRLSMQDEDGYSWEIIFFRHANTLVEVSSVTSEGNNNQRVEALAAYAEESLLQVLEARL